MRRVQREIADELRRRGGVIARRDRPELVSALKRAAATGELVVVLPGVYVARSAADDVAVLARAAGAWRSDAVVTGAAAARLTFWPEGPTTTVELAVPQRVRARPSRYRIVQRRVPPELVVTTKGARVSTPALTALDLCASVGGDGIDRVLLRRAATLAVLHDALERTPGRRGNRDRRAILLDSRDEPWSGAERLAHREFRAAGLAGWRTNLRVCLGGCTFYLDIAFPDLRIAVEIDGRSVHDSSAAFEHDRWRQNLLALDGWTVLRFTWRMLSERPAEVIAQVRAVIQNAESMRAVPHPSARRGADPGSSRRSGSTGVID